MLDQETERSSEGDAPSPHAVPASEPELDDAAIPPPVYDESIVEELGAVIDDAKLYAAAELAFQKTRAKLVGKNVGIALAAVVLAIILLHISIIALAVGLVMALEPLVTIWGAIAIVVGVMLLLVGLLGYLAFSRGSLIGEMFASDHDDASEDRAE
ncbi:MAG: phage holin family protein [Pseudomonadota bacterium]